jgi:hypothetical protein
MYGWRKGSPSAIPAVELCKKSICTSLSDVEAGGNIGGWINGDPCGCGSIGGCQYEL